MNIFFDPKSADGYRSRSQIARVITETWTKSHMYCPVCGWANIAKFPNNKAAADFYCPNCRNEFEQKSKNGAFGNKIADGAYSTFIQKINSNDNPDFFIMSYSLAKMKVENMFFIPKHFFVPAIVEKRKPLAKSAQRSGWIGCNILLNKIPVQGRVPIIQNGAVLEKNIVLNRVKWAQKIKTENISARGWLLDILDCVNTIESNVFTLNTVYLFEKELSFKHPDNNNIRAKIRQQMQQLRDRGIISFLGNGRYQKIKADGA